MSDILNRLSSLRDVMKQENIDVFLCTDLINVRYMTGFTGSAGTAIVSPESNIFITDERYREQVKSEVQHWETRIIISGNLFDRVAEIVKELGGSRIGIEADHLPLARYMDLSEKIVHSEFVPTDKLIRKFRQVKSQNEIKSLYKAGAVIGSVYDRIDEILKPGVSEKEVALWIRNTLEKLGAEKVSFPTIVLFGARASLPHGQPGDTILEPPAMVLMDFGGVVEGYHGDFTRTVFVGDPDQEFLNAYNLVVEAQRVGVDAVAPGKTGEEVDGAARKIIDAGGYGEYFIHALGHSLGLEIHESPRVAQRSEDVLQPGMIVTIEPGVYKPEWGGIRIEDMVLVTEKGGERLTKSSRELKIIS